MKSNYIAVYGVSNSSGVGIVEIDHTEDVVTWEFVGGSHVSSGTSPLFHDEERDDYCFMVGALKVPLSECIRVN
jgi:hypothetical protein